MADDKSKRGAADRRKVAGLEDYEVDYLRRKTGKSREEILRAIKKVGNSRDAVERELKK